MYDLFTYTNSPAYLQWFIVGRRQTENSLPILSATKLMMFVYKLPYRRCIFFTVLLIAQNVSILHKIQINTAVSQHNIMLRKNKGYTFRLKWSAIVRPNYKNTK